jgi:hypothetical protein
MLCLGSSWRGGVLGRYEEVAVVVQLHTQLQEGHEVQLRQPGMGRWQLPNGSVMEAQLQDLLRVVFCNCECVARCL